MLIWKSYNLNRFAKPTRCHPFNSLMQQPGVITCMVVILFAHPIGQYRSKMIMMKNLSRKSFIEAATCTAAKRMITRGKKVASVEGNEVSTWNFFVIEPIAAPSACLLRPGAVNLAKPSLVKYLFSALCNESKSHCSNDTQFQPAC